MTDVELKELVASLAIDQKEIARRLQETESIVRENARELTVLIGNKQESDRLLQEYQRMVNGMAQSDGEMAEAYFTRALEKNLQVGDLKFDEMFTNLKRKKKNGPQGQFDAALVNGGSALLVEIKYKLRDRDVIDVKERKLPIFRELNDFTVGKKVYVALAGMIIDDAALKLACEYGFFVLIQENHEFRVLNADLIAY
jgi:hypothetical protein